MPKLKNSQNIWQQAWTAEQPLFKQYAQMERFIKYCRIIGNNANQAMIYGEKGIVRGFLTQKSYKEVQEDGRKYLNIKKGLSAVLEIEKTVKNFWLIIKTVRSFVIKREDLHSKKFVSLFKDFNELVIKIFACFIATWEATCFYLEEELKKNLRECGVSNYEKKFISLVTPSKADLLLKEKIAWLAVLKKPTREKIAQHSLQFSFLFGNIDSDQEVIQLLEHKVKTDSLPKIKKEIAKSRERLKNVQREQLKIYQLCHSRKIRYLSSLLQRFTLLRLELKACWMGIHYYLFPFFVYLSKNTHCTIKEIMMYWSMKDIVNFLEKNVKLSKKEMLNRHYCYLILYWGNKIKFYRGQKAQKIKKQLLGDESRELKEFKGAIANRGIVRGRVKLIKFDDLRLVLKAAQGIKKKIILVTGMTNPNMVPLIKKAKGIITDEGGVTCHAAIISREFNLPCIIGTRIATQTLKDGDIVEVDANQGIVRILT